MGQRSPLYALATVAFLPLVACGVEVSESGSSASSPYITRVVFPSEMKGDGRIQYGTLSYRDEDAGLHLLEMKNITCPGDAFCHDSTIDLTDIDPTIPEKTSGSFDFGLTCDNNSGGDLESEWSLTLYDQDNHKSPSYTLKITCTSI